AAKPGGVESGAGAKDPARRNATGGSKAAGQLGHHVHGVAGHDEHRILGVTEDRRHDFVKDAGIALKKLQPAFSGLLSDTRTEDHDPAPGQVLILTGPNIKWMSKRYGVTEVVRLRGRARRVLVHQDDLASHALHHQGVAGGRTDKSAANDA